MTDPYLERVERFKAVAAEKDSLSRILSAQNLSPRNRADRYLEVCVRPELELARMALSRIAPFDLVRRGEKLILFHPTGAGTLEAQAVSVEYQDPGRAPEKGSDPAIRVSCEAGEFYCPLDLTEIRSHILRFVDSVCLAHGG